MLFATATLQHEAEALAQRYAGACWFARDRARYPLDEWLQWDELPLSSCWAPVKGFLVYVATIAVLQTVMRARAPVRLEYLFLLHNCFLCLFSLGIFVGIAQSVVRFYLGHGMFATWTDVDWVMPSTDIPLWCYLFYLSKYYELLDTFYLCLRKKPVQLVQAWHHSSVLFLFWSYMNARMMNHWPLVFLNAFVHVFVYGYFVCSCLKVRVPFKSAITILQITQFVLDMLWALPFPWFRVHNLTIGDWGPWVFGQLVGVSFVILFVRVFLNNRAREKAERADPHRSGKQKAG